MLCRPDVPRGVSSVDGAIRRRSIRGGSRSSTIPGPIPPRLSRPYAQPRAWSRKRLSAQADARFPGGVALRPAHRALRHRRTDQWRKLPRLCRAGSPPAPRARRHCVRTTAAVIRAAPFAPPSARLKPNSCSCPPTRQTSIRIKQAFAKKTLLRIADARTIDPPANHRRPIDCFIPTECEIALHVASPRSIGRRQRMCSKNPACRGRTRYSASVDMPVRPSGPSSGVESAAPARKRSDASSV